MSGDPRDYKLEISGVKPAGGADQTAEPGDSSAGARSRPFVSVMFNCCNVYVRIYRSADGLSYEGRCPRCGLPVRFRVGPGGSDSRFFVVT